MQERLVGVDAYTFGPYSLSSVERVLRYRGQPVVLAPKTLELLFELLADVNHVVSKADLIDRLWPESYVDEANLSQNIYVLRQLFKGHQSGIVVENVPKRGYRLSVPVAAPEPEVRNTHAKAVGYAGRYTRTLAALAAACIVVTATLVALHARPDTHRALHADALAKYLLARTYESAGSVQNLRRGEKLFEDVIRMSPQSAQGYAGLAESEASLAYYAATPGDRTHLQARAIDLAREAVATDPNSADAYASLGGVEFSIAHEDNPAQSDFQRALALNPNQPEALVWYATLLMNQGHVEAAQRMFGRALGIEPNSPGTVASLAWSDFVARDYTQAITLSKQMLVIHALPWTARITLADAYIASRNFTEARVIIEALRHNPQTRYEALALAAQLDALTGRAQIAARELRRLDDTADTRDTGDWDAASIAAAYVALHDRAHAYAWLDRVDYFERRLLARDPRFSALAGDPDFLSWTNG